MAKKITIDIEVNGKMQKATLSAKKLRAALDDVDSAQERAGKSARTYDRNTKGAAKTTSNSTKEFSKMAQGMGGLVGAYATVAASVFALSAAFNFFKQAADLAALTSGQELFAARTGASMKLMTSNIQAATGGLVAFKDAAQAAAIGQAAGLTADQMERLGKVAKNAGTILGRDVTDSFNRLTRGAIKAEPELLDELGIIIRIDRASQDYARTINKNANDLTQFEKTQAVVNAVLEQGSEKFQDVGDNVNQVAKFGAAFQDTFKKLSEPVAEVANFVAGALQDSILAVSSVIGILGLNIVKAFAPAGPALKNTAEEGIAARKRLMEAAQDETSSITAGEIKKGNFSEETMRRIENASKAKTSTVMNLSKMEGAAIRRDLAIIRAQNLRMTLEGKNAFEKMITNWRIQLLMFQADYGRVMGTIKAVTAAATMVMTRLLSALSVAGLIVMFVELGKQMRQAFFITPELRKAEEALDAITDSVNEQVAAVKEVQDSLIPATSELMRFSQAFGVVTNFNLGPVRSQINLLRESIEQLKSDTLKFDPKKTFEDIAPNESSLAMGQSTMMQTGLFDKDSIPKNVGEFNEALKEVANNQARAQAAFDKSTVGMSKFEAAIARTKAEFGELGEANRQYNQMQQAANVLGIGKQLVSEMEGADVAKTALDGLTPSLDLFRKELEALQGTGITVDEFDAGKMDELAGLLANANKEFKGMDPTAFEAALEEVVDAFEKTGVAAQEAIDKSARAKASFKGISDAANGFAEAADKFMPKGSNFNQLLSSMKEVENNFMTLSDTIDGLDTKTLNEITNMSDKVMDTESRSIAKTLELVNKLREDEEGILTGTITVQELRAELERQRLKLLDSQFLLEHKLTEEKIRQQKALVGQPKVMKSLLSAQAKQNDLAIALQKAQENYTIEVEKLELADANRKRELKNQVDLAEAQLAVAQEEARVQAALLPILRQMRDLKLEMSGIEIEKQVNAELTKQASLRQQIIQMQQDQIAKESDLAIKEAKLKNPFFDEENARVEARLLLEEAALQRAADEAQKNYDLKMKEIDIEYRLLDAKNRMAMLQMKASATELRARGGEENLELAALYDSLVVERQSLGDEQQNTRAVVEALAAASRDMAQVNLKQFRQDAELTRQALTPLNQVMNDAAGAFRTGLEDSVNALFTSMHDKSMDLGETLKEIGRGLLTTIQEAVTKKMIVDPLLDALNLGEEDPTEALKTALQEGADAVETKTKAGGDAAATAMKDGVKDGGTDVKNKMEQGGRSAAAEIREALRDIELRIKVQCCEGGGTGSDVGGAVADAVSSAVGGNITGSEGGLQNDGSGISVNADDPLIKQQLLSMKQSLLPQGQPEMMGYDFKTSVAEGVKQGILQSQADSMAQMKDPGSVGPMDSSLTDIAAPKLPPKPGTEAIANTEDAEETKAAATEENTGMLTKLGDVMGENVLQTGLAVSALLGNSKAGQALQKVMLALNAGQMIMKLWTALNTKSEVANTAAVVANTAAITASASANVLGGGRTGIYPPLGYATGGIARGPNAGYPAILHGTEAVVPLPNGKDIPVEMKGGGTSQQNNVTVNVTVDNQGQGTTESSQSDGERGGQLGAVISMAVQKELQNQKRPGGILSPYGVT